MKTGDKIITLFCVYTFASVAISLLAWGAVGLGFVAVAPAYTAGISALAWIIGAAIYVIALYLVAQSRTEGRVSIAVFGAYIVLQALALGHGFIAHGWYYAPAAGSQGTMPALLISLSMLVYLLAKRHKSPAVA